MRGWLGYIILLFISASCGAAACAASPARTTHSATITAARAPVIDYSSRGQQCDRLGNTEEIIAPYIQPGELGPVLLPARYGQLPAIYPADAAGSAAKRNKARIQPFYRLILFPFHAFW